MRHTDSVGLSSEALGESNLGCGGGALTQVCIGKGARMTAGGTFQRLEHSPTPEKIRTHLHQGALGWGSKAGGLVGRPNGKTERTRCIADICVTDASWNNNQT